MKNRLFLLLIVLFFVPTGLCAKDSLMVRDLEPLKVDKVTAKALSGIIKSTLSEHYEVQSMDALSAVSAMVEQKLKAGCDDTQCIMEVAGAMDIGLVVTGRYLKIRKPLYFKSNTYKFKGSEYRCYPEGF